MLVHTATTTHLEGLERVRRRGLRVRLDRAEHAPPRARVPRSMIVPVPPFQHSPTFGHRASSHTVFRFRVDRLSLTLA